MYYWNMNIGFRIIRYKIWILKLVLHVFVQKRKMKQTKEKWSNFLQSVDWSWKEHKYLACKPVVFSCCWHLVAPCAKILNHEGCTHHTETEFHQWSFCKTIVFMFKFGATAWVVSKDPFGNKLSMFNGLSLVILSTCIVLNYSQSCIILPCITCMLIK